MTRPTRMVPVPADCAVTFAVTPQVWVASVTEITVLELSAEDSDTPDEGLEFVVTPPSNGHLALRSAPSRHILNFTQHHIRSRQLLFAHSGQLLLGSFQLFYLTNVPHPLTFACRSSVGWFPLPGERRGELCPSGNLQHHSRASGPHAAEKPPTRGLPWSVLTPETRALGCRPTHR